MNKLYVEFYKIKLFSIKESGKVIKDYQIRKNTISRLINQNLIKRIKPGLFFIIPLDNKEFYPDKIHIASKLADNCYIIANTALSTYCNINDKISKTLNPNIIYISAKTHSKQRYENTEYKTISMKHTFGITTEEYQTTYGLTKIQITDLERTILDILKLKTIKLIDMLSIVPQLKTAPNIKRLTQYLDKLKKPIIYNKIGLILDATSKYTNITPEDLNDIHKKLSKKIFYLKEKGVRLIHPKYKYWKQWNCMIEEELFNKLKLEEQQTMNKITG